VIEKNVRADECRERDITSDAEKLAPGLQVWRGHKREGLRERRTTESHSTERKVREQESRPGVEKGRKSVFARRGNLSLSSFS
jgi:hypothetical protein